MNYIFFFKSTAFAVILLFLLTAPSAPSAQAGVCGPLVPESCAKGMCDLCHVFELLSNLINFFVFCLTPPIAALMIAISGLILIFGGSEKAQTIGKKMFTSTIIALVIIYASWLFVDTLIQVIGGTNQGSWWQYQCGLPSVM